MFVGDCETADSNAIDDVRPVRKFSVVSRGELWAPAGDMEKTPHLHKHQEHATSAR